MGTREGQPGKNTIRIGIVDNDPCALHMMSLLVEQADPAFRMTWVAENAQHALEHCLYDEQGTKAQVLLLDMALHGLSGPDVCERIRRHDADVGIIGVTAYPIKHYRDALVRSGAQGLLEKHALGKPDVLANAIAQAAHGQAVIPGFPTPQAAHAALVGTTALPSLTHRETEILRMYSDHMSTEDIAGYLNISSGTVFSHVHHAMGKLSVSSRNEAIKTCRAIHLF
ncbi:LuxR C-terminal-related transcriptional regulator [Bifidobacterium cuniculi]|uniref:LuxR family two component transcriptional regulator n=1 Tax=Bifidobacterium cuniculi TaxID=1688 RepID=A0A087B3B7_9BIFI|nr:response regulator transcription factor [Bifidobacterium cuniculi]KFI65517.1 LuxR family two component transcriptional regulator [Bifidobacterium cuniculi]